MKNKNHFLKIFLILGVLALVKPLEGNAQHSLTFEKNIKLPDSLLGSSAIMDIVYANGKVFAYSASGVLVFDEDSLHFITKVSFPTDGQYGKFNPQYYDRRLWLDDINVMAVKGGGNQSKIFVVTPDLDIIRIDATTHYSSSTVVNRPDSLSSFRPMSGANILKYDNVHDRLYWLITGKNQQANCIGNFHYRNRYFAIFDGNTNNNLTLYYDEFYFLYNLTTPYINPYFYSVRPGKCEWGGV